MNLYKQNDTLGITFFQIPMTLFASTRYKGLSLTAKVAYGLMLNRMQLSSINGWVNDKQEVYIIYTREQMAKQLGISYKSVVAVFRELNHYRLIQERRRGNGLPNHIYLYKVEATEAEAEDYCADSRCEEMSGQLPLCGDPESRDVKMTDPDVKYGKVLNCKKDRSGYAESTGQDVKILHTSQNDISKTDINQMNGSDIESSQSIYPEDDETDDTLAKILRRCELYQFDSEEAQVLKEAVQRLYYSAQFRFGDAVIPRARVRTQLQQLNGEILQNAYDSIRSNTRPVTNCMGYIMAVIYNAITEYTGHLMTDPYLNFLYARSGKRGNSGVKS